MLNHLCIQVSYERGVDFTQLTHKKNLRSSELRLSSVHVCQKFKGEGTAYIEGSEQAWVGSQQYMTAIL